MRALIRLEKVCIRQNVHFLRTLFLHSQGKFFFGFCFCSKKRKFARRLTMSEVSRDQKCVSGKSLLQSGFHTHMAAFIHSHKSRVVMSCSGIRGHTLATFAPCAAWDFMRYVLHVSVSRVNRGDGAPCTWRRRGQRPSPASSPWRRRSAPWPRPWGSLRYLSQNITQLSNPIWCVLGVLFFTHSLVHLPLQLFQGLSVNKRMQGSKQISPQ